MRADCSKKFRAKIYKKFPRVSESSSNTTMSEISLERKFFKACSICFKENHKCDVLASEHRPSCIRQDQLVPILKKLRNCFMYYLRVVIILLSTGLCKSAFSTCCFGKTKFSSFYVLVFRVSVSLAFNF